MKKKIIMNPPSVWTDHILWRRTVQENSLSRRVRTNEPGTQPLCTAHQQGINPTTSSHVRKREINAEARSTSLPNTSGVTMLMPEDALSFPGTQNPAVCLFPAAPDPWNVPCRTPGKPALATGRGFRHSCFVIEETWNELSTIKEASWVFQEHFAFLYNTSTSNEVNPSPCH